MLEQLRTFLIEFFAVSGSPAWIDIVLLAAVAIAAIITYYATKALLYCFEYLVAWTSVTWDDEIFNSRMLRALSQLAPALTVRYMLPSFFDDTTTAHRLFKVLTALYILVTVVYIVCILISNVRLMMSNRDNLRKYAMGGIFGMLKLIAVGIGVIVGLSIIFSKEPASILTAIGASAAVLMLVFKDTILGLVASVQFSVNNMLREGDWIVCDSHGINGEVLKVSLTTIKVQNWDNSISTIPPYTLVSDSFRNYQAMRLAGGRRVDRSVLLDASTIRFLSAEEIERLRADGRLDGIDIPDPRRLVNSHLLRLYLDHFLATDPRVCHDMLCMVRQMELTPTGLPLQLYFFTHITEWRGFEVVQSDIFDHVYAVVNEFGLRIFQSPTGTINPRL